MGLIELYFNILFQHCSRNVNIFLEVQNEKNLCSFVTFFPHDWPSCSSIDTLSALNRV